MSEYMVELRRRVGDRLLEVPSVSVVVRDGRGGVLLVRHENDDAWVTPGGAVEPAEAPADAAVREMWEETGLEVELTRIIGVYGGPEFVVTYRNGDRTSYLMVVFEGRPIAGEPRPDGVETLEVRYFAREEARAVSTPSWLNEILEDVFADHPGTAFRPACWSPPAA
jgi:8-oxo-dGTP pyrophosphatase MutT (NUDIX family)